MRIHGLFQKRLAGDDALLELARLRFDEVAMGPEIHSGSPADFAHQYGFRPETASTAVVHLPRNWNVLNTDHHDGICALAGCAAGKAFGFVIHDLNEIETDPGGVLQNLHRLATRLRRIPNAPILFVEYAVGLDPVRYIDFLRKFDDCEEISACLDVGHIGIRQARKAYAAKYPGEDACALHPDSPELPDRIEALAAAVQSALPVTIKVIRAFTASETPIHFHLHDGHPLANSKFGVSDHRGFLAPIAIPFAHNGRRSLPPLFGPSGLRKILATALTHSRPEQLTFTLEIHETGGRLPLGNAKHFFHHWKEIRNAEQMSHWLNTLQQQAELFRAIWAETTSS